MPRNDALMGGFRIRAAEVDDLPFLLTMLVAAVNFTPDRRTEPAVVLADPRIAGYLAGWPRDGDRGFLAVDDHGLALGASWRRYRTTDNQGYGFVSPDIPELTIAVRPTARGGGIGRALLRAVADDARECGLRMLSLSVEHANQPALKLYLSEGWRSIASDDDAATLVLDLAGPDLPDGQPDR